MRIRLITLLVTGAVTAAACGGSGTASTPATSMTEMANMGSMGDPAATAAGDVTGAALVSGEFRLLAASPDAIASLAGHADLARHGAGTTVTVELANLMPGTDYIAHVHAANCFNAGGPHYMFDTTGAAVPPNEIHLAFTAQPDGTGFMTVENPRVAGETAVSVVVHERSPDAPKLACVDLD